MESESTLTVQTGLYIGLLMSWSKEFEVLHNAPLAISVFSLLKGETKSCPLCPLSADEVKIPLVMFSI